MTSNITLSPSQQLLQSCINDCSPHLYERGRGAYETLISAGYVYASNLTYNLVSYSYHRVKGYLLGRQVTKIEDHQYRSFLVSPTDDVVQDQHRIQELREKQRYHQKQIDNFQLIRVIKEAAIVFATFGLSGILVAEGICKPISWEIKDWDWTMSQDSVLATLIGLTAGYALNIFPGMLCYGYHSFMRSCRDVQVVETTRSIQLLPISLNDPHSCTQSQKFRQEVIELRNKVAHHDNIRYRCRRTLNFFMNSIPGCLSLVGLAIAGGMAMNRRINAEWSPCYRACMNQFFRNV